MDLKQRANTLAQLIDNRRQHVTSRARRRVWRWQQAVRTRTHDTRVSALGVLDKWTDPLAETAVVGGLANLVDRGLAAATVPSIEAYDERTVKDIAKLVRELEDTGELRRIAAYEAANKGRKTVAGAVEKRLSQLVPPVVALVPWEIASEDEQTETETEIAAEAAAAPA